MNDRLNAGNSLDPFRRRGLLTTESTSRSVLWSVEHYRPLLASEQYTCSDTFRVPTISNSLFYLFLSLVGNTFSLIVYRNTRIQFPSPNAKNVSIRAVVTIKDTINQILITRELAILKDNASPPIAFEKTVESPRFVNEGRLEIHCTVINDESQPSSLFQSKQESKDSLKDYVPSISCDELKEHLQVMLDGEVENNVSIFVDGEVFQVHRSLLCSHSSVFAAMFKHDTLEKAENHVHIDDVSAEAVGEILSFIYFGNTSKMSHKLATEVYMAADKYAMTNLRRKCSNFLIANLGKDSVLDVLLVADRHGDNELKAATIQFLVKKVPSVIETDTFLLLLETESELARSIIMHLVRAVNN